MNKELWGTVLALCAAVVSGFSIPLNKIFLVDLEPSVFTAVRSLIIGVVFLVIALGQCRFKLKGFKKTSWKYLIAIGLIGGAIAFLMYFTGLKLTTAGRAAFLHKTLPLYIGLLAFVFLKEKLTRKQWYAMGLMLLGTFAIYFSQVSPDVFWASPGLGDVLVIGATILWAVESVLAKKAMLDGESNFVVTFGRMFIGAVFLFIAVGFLGSAGSLTALSMQQWVNILASTAILLLYVLFWYGSIKLIDVSRAGIMLLLAPVISLLLGFLIMHEPVAALQLAGSAMILAGAYMAVKIKGRVAAGV